MKKNNKKILVSASVVLSIGSAFAILSLATNHNEQLKLINDEIQENNSDFKEINNKNVFEGTRLTRDAVIALGWDRKTEITLNDWRIQAPNVTIIGFENGLFKDFVWPRHSILRLIHIPNRITVLGDYTFRDIAPLQTIIFEENSRLATIRWEVITGTSIASLVIPRSVRRIEFSAFRGIKSLKLLTFEHNSQLQFIGQDAFRNANIESMYIPDSVTAIGQWAFKDTVALTGNEISMPLRFRNSAPFEEYGFEQKQWNDITWRGLFKGNILTKEAVALLGWERKRRITLMHWEAAANVTQIGNGQSNDKPFSNSLILQSIEIPNSITTINDFAFNGLSSLNDISFASNTKLVTIGTNAFSQSGITAINVPNSVKTIRNNAFGSTNRLEGNKVAMSITLKQTSTSPLYGFTQQQWDNINWKIEQFTDQILTPQAVVSLGWDSQREITLEDWASLAPNVTTIKQGAFSNNLILQLIEIPDSVTTIENNVFNGTTALQGPNISMKIRLKASSTLPLYGFTAFQWNNIDWRVTPFTEAILTKEAVVALGWNTATSITLTHWEKYAPNVTQIGPIDGTIINSPFNNNSIIESIMIPDKITSISNFAFANTTQLKNVSIGQTSNLTTIGDEAFSNSSIMIINIPDSVTTIGANTFKQTNLLDGRNVSMAIKMKAGSRDPLYGFTLAQWNSLNLRISQFTNSVLTKEAVFSLGWDTKLSISINDWKEWAPNVTQLGDPNVTGGSGETSPFAGNSILQSIEIPSKVTSINFAAFHQTSKLKGVSFENGSQLRTIGSHAFKQSTLVSIDVPALVTQIGDNAFEKTSSLRIVNFTSQENLTTIGTQAFWGSGIVSITIPNSVKSIRANAFLSTTSLLGINILMPIRLQASSTTALYGLTNDQWNSIRWLTERFEGNTLTKEAVISLGWDTRISITQSDWTSFAPNVTQIGDPNITIGQEDLAPFSKNSILQSIEIPSKVTSINFAAFYKTTKLQTVKFTNDSQLATIGNSSFMESTISTMEIPNSVITIGNDSFASSKITLVNIPASLTTLGNFAFFSTDSLETVIFDKKSILRTIGNNAFSNSAITSIEIPDSVTSIRTNAFANTNLLEGNKISMKIQLRDDSPLSLYGFSEEQWKSISWRIEKFMGEILTKEAVSNLGWNHIDAITLEQWKNLAPNVKQIGTNGRAINDGPFSNNKTLQSIDIPKTISLIGAFAFGNTSSLKTIVFESGSSLTTIGNSAFLNSGLSQIEIPSLVNSIANNAFENNLALNNVTLSYSLFKGGDSSAPQFGFTKAQWDNLNWNNIPTSDVLINSIIARHLLKSDSIIVWEEISTYSGIESNAFSNTNITSITIEGKPNFIIQKNSFLNTSKTLTTIRMNESFRENVSNYGFTQEQINGIIYLNLGSSLSTTVIVISSILAVLLVISISVGTIAFVKHLKNKEEPNSNQYLAEKNDEFEEEPHYSNEQYYVEQ